MKLAILQMADTPQIESSAVMLRHAGYEVKVCGQALRNELQRAGCDTVLAVQTMIDIGYDALDPSIQEAQPWEMEKCDLFCEIKCRNLEKIWWRWPRLRNRTAWWRVNGARPEHVIRDLGHGKVEDCGNEMEPECPVITANLWYGEPEYDRPPGTNYVFWPPYPRARDYDPIRRGNYLSCNEPGKPFGLIHGIYGWGFKEIVGRVKDLGVDLYGSNAPAGMVHHRVVSDLVATRLCMVHLKGVDCPGWSLYEALLGGCPVVVPRWLIHRMLAFDLFKEGETCYAFGSVPNEHGRGPMDWDLCVQEIETVLAILSDRENNLGIGMAGRERLLELMWRPDKDGLDWLGFLQKHGWA